MEDEHKDIADFEEENVDESIIQPDEKQKKKKKRRKRRFLKIIIAFGIIIALFLFFLSSIAKWYIEKNGEDLIGRKVSIGQLNINYLKFSVKAKDFILYEEDAQNPFVSFDEFVVNMDPWRLLKSQYAFSEIKLVNPFMKIVSHEMGFNFDDIIEHFSSDDDVEIEIDEDIESTIMYLVKNFALLGGQVIYEDKIENSITEIKNLNLTIPEIAWDNQRSDLGVEFELGDKGTVALKAIVDQVKSTYEIQAKLEDVEISPFKSYLNDLINAGSLTGLLNSDLNINGSLSNLMNIVVTGTAELKDLIMTDPNMMPFLIADKIFTELKDIDLGKDNYSIGRLEIDNAKLSAVLNNDGANFDAVLEPFFADTISESDSEMHYSIEKIVINNTHIAYSDHTLNRDFHVDISDINFIMLNFGDLATKVPFNFSMNINNTGKLEGDASIDATSFETLYLHADLKNLDMIFLSPYSEYFLARPITKGNLNYECTINLTPQYLDNNNYIKIIDFETGKKTKDSTAYKVPMGLALYVLKDRNDIIEINLPVHGDPSDPSFKLRRIIWKTLEEFLIKTAATPFKAIGNLFGGNPEKIKEVNFNWLQAELDKEQTDNLDRIAKFIRRRDKIAFVFTQTTDIQKEKSLIAVHDVKLSYLQSIMPDENINFVKNLVDELEFNDIGFLDYIKVNDENADFDVISKACLNIYGNEKAQKDLESLFKTREQIIKAYFMSKGTPSDAYSFAMIDFRNIPDEMKTPKFIIDVSLR